MSRDELLEYIQSLQAEIRYLKDAFRAVRDQNLVRIPKGKQFCPSCGNVTLDGRECKICRTHLWGPALPEKDRAPIDQRTVNVEHRN